MSTSQLPCLCKACTTPAPPRTWVPLPRPVRPARAVSAAVIRLLNEAAAVPCVDQVDARPLLGQHGRRQRRDGAAARHVHAHTQPRAARIDNAGRRLHGRRQSRRQRCSWWCRRPCLAAATIAGRRRGRCGAGWCLQPGEQRVEQVLLLCWRELRLWRGRQHTLWYKVIQLRMPRHKHGLFAHTHGSQQHVRVRRLWARRRCSGCCGLCRCSRRSAWRRHYRRRARRYRRHGCCCCCRCCCWRPACFKRRSCTGGAAATAAAQACVHASSMRTAGELQTKACMCCSFCRRACRVCACVCGSPDRRHC